MVLTRFLLFMVVFLYSSSVFGGDIASGIEFFGDLRLRSEYIDNKGFNKERYQWRQRYRLRFGAGAGVTEHVEVGIRFASGEPSYQTTGNQTLDGENFKKFEFRLDRVFARYSRKIGGVGFTLRAGKFAHPFWYPTEIVWDGDLQPQGVSETLEFGNTTVHLAQYVIRQADRNDLPGGSNNGNELYAFQVVHGLELGGMDTKMGVSYYSVSDPAQLGRDARASNSDFTTNKNFNTCTSKAGFTSTVSTPCFGEVSDFNILNLTAQVAFLKDGPLPVRIVGEYVKNMGARSFMVYSDPSDTTGAEYGREDTAWLLGIGAGTKRPGTWRYWLSYSQIEADSVVANFNSDDLQQTNVNTTSILVSYQITEDMYVYYDGYFQTRNNYRLAVDNGNASTDDTTMYRHRINWVMHF